MSKSYLVSRSVEIAAPPASVFPHVNDLHRWQQWSPWEGIDPELRRRYSEPANGVGATYHWEGNSKAGKGSMEITHSEESKVGIDLHFDKPFKAENTVAITLAPTATGTLVTWAMSGQKNLFLRLASPVINMDKMLGKDFEKGLAQLKAVVESGR